MSHATITTASATNTIPSTSSATSPALHELHERRRHPAFHQPHLPYTTSPPPAAHRPTLRPYQEECIQQTLREAAAGTRRMAVSLPVGSGKTVIFAQLLARLPPPSPRRTQTLVLAHRTELLEQALARIRAANPQLRVELDQGSSAASPDADVVVASVARWGRTGAAAVTAFDRRRLKCIIIDEAHHAAASSYLRILDHFGLEQQPLQPP